MSATKITYNIWQTGMGWVAWVFPAYWEEWVSRHGWGMPVETDMEILVCSVPFFIMYTLLHTQPQRFLLSPQTLKT